MDVVDTLLSPGLLELPFSLLHNLETPAIIRIVMKQADNLETTTTYTPEFCPYTGIRRDMVAVIDNCAHRRKHVQDGKQTNGILFMSRQCVTNENNPYLRKWGIQRTNRR